MPTKRYTPEQIIHHLREAEVHLNQGMTTENATRQIGVSVQTYYRWRKEYGGMRTNQAKRLKELEKENSRPRCLRPEAVGWFRGRIDPRGDCRQVIGRLTGSAGEVYRTPSTSSHRE